MPAKKQTANANKPVSRPDAGVDEFLRKLKHPLKKDIEFIRQIILGVSPEIGEGIKWNSPSFRTKDYFATLNLRAKDGKDRIWLILHLGAKVKDNSKALKIADPTSLLQWLAKDRCLIIFEDRKDIEAKKSAFKAVLREWIKQV